MVKPGACVIDVGISRIIDKSTGKSKLVGDVDYEGKLWINVKSIKSHIL
jgi:methylenetetrahydrofolate dehydrogenase(NAD+)/5,10-methenyltetrahydrofolate cyclohydrolase